MKAFSVSTPCHQHHQHHQGIQCLFLLCAFVEVNLLQSHSTHSSFAVSAFTFFFHIMSSSPDDNWTMSPLSVHETENIDNPSPSNHSLEINISTHSSLPLPLPFSHSPLISPSSPCVSHLSVFRQSSPSQNPVDANQESPQPRDRSAAQELQSPVRITMPFHSEESLSLNNNKNNDSNSNTEHLSPHKSTSSYAQKILSSTFPHNRDTDTAHLQAQQSAITKAFHQRRISSTPHSPLPQRPYSISPHVNSSPLYFPRSHVEENFSHSCAGSPLAASPVLSAESPSPVLVPTPVRGPILRENRHVA